MDDRLPEEYSSEERAALAKARAEKRVREVIEPWLEQRRCGQWGIPYDAENPAMHREQLAMRDAAMREIYTQHTRNWKWIGAAGRAVGAGSRSAGQKAWDVLMGAIVLIGLGWIATRLGIKLPGVP